MIRLSASQPVRGRCPLGPLPRAGRGLLGQRRADRGARAVRLAHRQTTARRRSCGLAGRLSAVPRIVVRVSPRPSSRPSPPSEPSSTSHPASPIRCWPRPRRPPPMPAGTRPAGRVAAPRAGAGMPATSIWWPSIRRGPPTSTRPSPPERRGDGFRINYAIADVGAFVRAGGRRRRRGPPGGAPPSTAPTPAPPSTRRSSREDRASLLAGTDKPALLWTIDLDGDGRAGSTAGSRAGDGPGDARPSPTSRPSIASRQRGPTRPPRPSWPEIGTLRQAREADRGGVSLNLPAQEVVERNGVLRPGLRPVRSRSRGGTPRSRC